MLEGIKNAIGVIAPTLATALGGPLAGAAVATIGKALGLGESAPAQQVLQHLQQQQMTPAEQLAVQQADNDFKIEMQKMAYTDVADARDREVKLADSKWGWLSLSVQNFGALVIILIMIVMTGWALFGKDIDPQNLSQIINTNYNIILLLVGYWWGKSKKED